MRRYAGSEDGKLGAAASLELTSRLGLWIGGKGYRPTLGACPDGHRIYKRRGEWACTEELLLRMVTEKGEVVLKTGQTIRVYESEGA